MSRTPLSRLTGALLALPLMLVSAIAPGAGNSAQQRDSAPEGRASSAHAAETITSLEALYEDEVTTADPHDLTAFMPSEIARLFGPVPPSPPPPPPPKPEIRVKAHPPRT